MKFKVILIFIYNICCQNISDYYNRPLIWPLPKNLEFSQHNFDIISFSYQDFNFVLNDNLNIQIQLLEKVSQTFQHYFNKIFYSIDEEYAYDLERINSSNIKYQSNNKSQALIFINIKNQTVISPSILQLNESIKNEQYEIVCNKTFNCSISSETYNGFLHAMASISQLIKKHKNGYLNIFEISYLPLKINDEPTFRYRGIMIDTGRHFIPLKDIYKTIDSLMYNKLNVLHIHFSDGDSFPIFLRNHSNITFSGAFSLNEIYWENDLIELGKYGILRGVKIIPELDTPGHARSWGLHPDYEDIVSCVGINWAGGAVQPPAGHLDPTNNLTYEVIKSVINDLEFYFPDEIIHLGGDEVITSCWDKKPSIKNWIQQEGKDLNINDYGQLGQYFRQLQRSFLSSNKVGMYWDQGGKSHMEKGDIAMFWGNRGGAINYKNNQNIKVVLASNSILYLDCGLGHMFGGSGTWCGGYHSWKDIYEYDPNSEGLTKEQLLGSQIPLFGELVNSGNLEERLWIRASALAERLWNNNQFEKLALKQIDYKEVIPRFFNFYEILLQRGIKSTPPCSRYCSKNVEKCF